MFDAPYYYHLDVVLLVVTLLVGLLVIADRILRFVYHPILEVVDAVFNTCWMLSVGGGMSVHIAFRNWRRERAMRRQSTNPSERLMRDIADARIKPKLVAFCERQHAAENIQCLLRIIEYEELLSASERVKQYIELYELHLQTRSFFEVNVSAHIKKEMVKPGPAETAAISELDRSIRVLKHEVITNLLDPYVRFESSVSRK